MTRSSTVARLALLGSAQFMTAVDFDIVFVALPEIGRRLGLSAQAQQAVVSAYTVVFGGFLLLGGRAADRLGARRTFAVGLALFGAASLVAGLATGPAALVAARAVQGFGAALLTPSTLKLVTTGFPAGPRRDRAMAVWGAAGASGAAVGALGGGVLTGLLGWDAVFFVNVPLVAVALLATPVLPRGAAVRADRFDLPGALLATAGATLVVFGLVSGPGSGWLTVRGGGALLAGALLLGGCLLVESRSRDPLVPPALLANRHVLAAIVVVFVFMGAVATEYYLFTTYLQDVLGYSPLQAGAAFLPLGLCSTAASARAVPPLLHRFGPRAALVAGLAGVAASMVVLAVGMPSGTYWAVLPGVVLWGVSAGVAFPPVFVAVTTGVPADRHGVASALASTAQYLGSAVGLAALVAVSGTPVSGLWGAALVTVVGAALGAVLLRGR